jgi:glycosyltransferase involved in cell wall biosynthesis
MKIAHILSSFGMGGQERVALDLAARQRARGDGVITLALAAGPMRADFAAAGVDTRVVDKPDGLSPSVIGRLAWILRQERVDVVHTHNPQALIYGAPAARLAGAAAIHTKHGANPDNARRVALRRLAARLCRFYVAVSPLTAEVAEKNREAPRSRMRVVENGIDLSRFGPSPIAGAEVRAELGIPLDAFIIGTVGRAAPEKNQALLLRASLPLIARGAWLVVAGDGPELPSLRAAAPRGALFLGARRDTPRLYAAFDVFSLSSHTEGLPLVLPEAMASGLPVVSTAVGGIPTVISEGETGLLTPPGDERALTGALSSLFEDRARAQAMGAAARAWALARYDAARMVADYDTLYRASTSVVGR